MSETNGEVPELADLPDLVRQRVVALAAGSLPDVPRLPASVRRVATFAPARRARLGGRAIAEALADDGFRDRLGVQLAARPAPAPDDPAGLAAWAWLLRPEGWEAALADEVRRVADEPARPDTAELDRLQTRLADADQAAREQRAAHRVQVEELKTENTTLRRKLGEARTAERGSRAVVETATRDLEAGRAASDSRAAALEKDNRRLRAQVERLESELSRLRSDARVERDRATLRARVLMETVLDAASGLQRELALPQVGGEPADLVEADVAGAGTRTTSAAGALGPASPALLEQFLAMPRARLIIDGYNVSKSAWPTSTLEAQRIRLLTSLAPLVARTGASTTVVFDAAETDHRPPVVAPRGVKVLYSPRGVIADDVIRDLVAVEPEGRVVVVVTADRELGTDVARSGARVASPVALLEVVAR